MACKSPCTLSGPGLFAIMKATQKLNKSGLARAMVRGISTFVQNNHSEYHHMVHDCNAVYVCLLQLAGWLLVCLPPVPFSVDGMKRLVWAMARQPIWSSMDLSSCSHKV